MNHQFEDENRELYEKFHIKNIPNGGKHGKATCELGHKYQLEIKRLHTEMLRNIEDILMENYQHKDIERVPALENEAERFKNSLALYKQKMKEFEKPSRTFIDKPGLTRSAAKQLVAIYFENNK